MSKNRNHKTGVWREFIINLVSNGNILLNHAVNSGTVGKRKIGKKNIQIQQTLCIYSNIFGMLFPHMGSSLLIMFS